MNNLNSPHGGLVSGHRESAWICPVCQTSETTYLSMVHEMRLDICSTCGLITQHTVTSNPGNQPSLIKTDETAKRDLLTSDTERRAASDYVHLLSRHTTEGTVLLVADDGHPFADLAKTGHFHVATHVNAQQLFEASLQTDFYDIAVVIYSLEKTLNPISALEKIHAALKTNGILLLTVPILDSWSAEFFRSGWIGWQPDNLYYFNSQTIQSALHRSGFAHVRIRPDYRHYSLQHVYRRAQAARQQTRITRLVRVAYHLLPQSVSRNVIKIRLSTSGIVIVAQSQATREHPLLSVIMPVYNEGQTVSSTLQAVLDKKLDGIDKEVIIVESNSTDDSLEKVKHFQQHPEVRLVLEERPRGKGHAVRTGFDHARGDFILIQDADQEYDIDDYDVLIDALRKYRSAFVLGSRHTDSWKIREFGNQPGISAYFNFGHFLFCGSLNLLYKQHMKDPFTMYKVFRKDCLYGLQFESNRFDFDFELVIKLVRKGYTPLEIPVNYHARSFSEGKKVRVFRDPLTWIRALIKFRFSPLYPDDSHS